MQIALRSKDGTVQLLDPDTSFVELRTDEGTLAGLFYLDTLGRAHTCVDPAAPQAKAYTRIYKMEFATDIKRIED